ncbi:unnamed protein product [Linum trigynum]|uniref:U-box domain-containing protein n=1 Tax=Linum trigynum TaxID=586398 RepID=A0AAV2CU24_9ROSI
MPKVISAYVQQDDLLYSITRNILTDPVTIEIGQTYERKSIQEWLDRGNSSCPITRQKLTITLLHNTNYVLKRLIATWLEQNPTSSSSSIQTHLRWQKSATSAIGEPTTPSLSPNSVIVAAAAVDGSVAELRHAINNLCMSEILDESEAAVLTIERLLTYVGDPRRVNRENGAPWPFSRRLIPHLQILIQCRRHPELHTEASKWFSKLVP